MFIATRRRWIDLRQEVHVYSHAARWADLLTEVGSLSKPSPQAHAMPSNFKLNFQK